MRQITITKLVLAAGFGALVALAGAASAGGLVSCGNAGLGLRQFTVDPALVGGFCYAQNGNFIGDDFSVTGIPDITLIDKDTEFPEALDELRVSALSNSNTAGIWTLSTADLWDTWDRLFLAAHYGGGGNTPEDNPDSFVVELEPFDTTGSFALTGIGIQLNGLSNLYLVGVRCTTPDCNCPPNEPDCGDTDIPEPGTLLLLGAAALGLATRRRLFG